MLLGMLDRLRRLQRLGQLLEHLLLLLLGDRRVALDLVDLLLDRDLRLGEGLALRIDAGHHHGDVGGDVVILGEAGEAVLLGDGLELGLHLGIGLVGVALHLLGDRRPCPSARR